MENTESLITRCLPTFRLRKFKIIPIIMNNQAGNDGVLDGGEMDDYQPNSVHIAATQQDLIVCTEVVLSEFGG